MTEETWPDGVRPLSFEQAGDLGVDEEGELYWRGKRIEIKRPLSLTFWQKIGAGVIALFTIVGAVGSIAQGWAAYNDWACRVKWWAVVCAPIEKPITPITNEKSQPSR